MKRNILISGLILVLVIMLAVHVYDAFLKQPQPANAYSRTIDGYVVTAVGGRGNPFCGDDQVTRASDGKYITTLSLCEDNIDSIRADGEWVTIETTMQCTYKEHLLTGLNFKFCLSDF